jgi:glycosyltransferase involved in cell wall biosynthesis
MRKLAILVSHPIQYQTPLFKKISHAKEIELAVYFCWEGGARKPYFDWQFGQQVRWDIPLLEGYNYKFLRNFSPAPSSDFWGQINPGIIIELIRGRYDAILIYGWNSLTNWLAFATAFLTKTPIILHAENPLNQELQKSSFKLKTKKIIFTRFFRRIAAFLYIGEENKKFYKYYGMPAEKLFFAPYAVNNDYFIAEYKNLINKKIDLRKELGLPPDKVVILFSGKLISKKRPMDLLRAFERARSDKKYLIFLGDGALRKELESYAKKNNIRDIFFAGFCGQRELPKFYAASDIFVLPSGFGETWGLVVNEAMCFKLPIIASDIVGCSSDLVKTGENGFVFEVGNIDSLTGHLEQLLKDGEMRKSFGDKSFEIIKNYSHKEDLKALVDVLHYL